MTEQRATTPDLLRYVADNADWLAHRADALDAFDELHDLIDQVKHTIDTRNPGSYAGPCDVCGRDMYAQPGKPVVQCRMCNLDYDLEPRRQKLLKTAKGRIARPSEIARALSSIGAEIKSDRIRKWIERGQLKPAGYAPKKATDVDEEGPALYRIRDVLDLLDRPAKPPKKRGA